jgi:hypothetical protein
MARYIVGAALLAASGLLLFWNWPRETPPPAPVYAQVPDYAGTEERQDDAYFENGWNVSNVGAIRLKDFFFRFQPFLNDPVGGFDGRSQAFRFGRLTFNPANPPDWQIELDNLGQQDMQIEGYTPQPGRSPHPAVRDWLIGQLEAGLDVVRLVGRFISDPVCDKKTRRCRQWTEKQRFEFEEDAVTADQVRRAPLGLWFTHPKTRPVERPQEPIAPPQPTINYPSMGLAAVLGLVGLLLFIARGEGGSARRTLG